jgi:hypothetical protein
MLSRFNIAHKVRKTISHKARTDFLQILAWTGDNALSNDTQNTSLGDSPNNSFEAVNRVRCYNHTLNLAVQAFLRPFSPPPPKKGSKGKGKAKENTDNDTEDNNDYDTNDSDSDINDGDLEDDEELPDLADISTDPLDNVDDVDDSAWKGMEEAEQAALLAETDSVKQVITRVCPL